jgi:ribosomal protein L10
MTMRGKAEMFVGKNTMVRFVIKKFAEEHKNSGLLALADELEGNVAVIFTNEDLRDVCAPPLQSHRHRSVSLLSDSPA